MGLLMTVDFNLSQYDDVLDLVVERRDNNGILLDRVVGSGGIVNYFKIHTREGFYAFSEPPFDDNVFMNLSSGIDLNRVDSLSLMHRIKFQHHRKSMGISHIDLQAEFPNCFVDKLERRMELQPHNLSGLAAEMLADWVSFESKKYIYTFFILSIKIVERGDRVSKVNITLQSEDEKPRILHQILKEDYKCTLRLRKEERTFHKAEMR